MRGFSPDRFHQALAVAALLLLIVVLRQAVHHWVRRRRIVGRLVQARRGEARARQLLESRGYAVIDAQSAGSYTLSIDGAEMEIPLRADYLVTRNGLRYVAEVKTGALAPHIRTPATRRQLLEYRVAFDVDGVLLVDAEEHRVHVVRFPLPEPGAARLSPWGWILVAIGVTALIAAQWR